MWITILDKDREYVINFDNILCFAKITDCKHKPCIELAIAQGGINLSYETEEERDSVYDLLLEKLSSLEI